MLRNPVEVTPEEWADFLVNFECYHTEGTKEFSSDTSRPLITHRITRRWTSGNDTRYESVPAGMVRYASPYKMYFIDKINNPIPPKENGTTH